MNNYVLHRRVDLDEHENPRFSLFVKMKYSVLLLTCAILGPKPGKLPVTRTKVVPGISSRVIVPTNVSVESRYMLAVAIRPCPSMAQTRSSLNNQKSSTYVSCYFSNSLHRTDPWGSCIHRYYHIHQVNKRYNLLKDVEIYPEQKNHRNLFESHD